MSQSFGKNSSFQNNTTLLRSIYSYNNSMSVSRVDFIVEPFWI